MSRAGAVGRSDRLFTKAFGLLVSGHLLQSLGYSSMLLLPLYLDHLGADYEEIGRIMAVSSIGGLAARPLIGWALDAIGRRPTLVGGTVLLSASMGLCWFVTDRGPLIYLVRLLFGLGVGALFTGYFTFAADLVPTARRTEGLALFGISGLVPLVINPLASTIGVRAPDLRWFFPLLGLLVVSSLAAVFALREPQHLVDREPLRRGDVWSALRHRELWSVWLATIVFSGLVAMFFVFVTVVAKRRGAENPALFWLSYAVGAVAVRAIGARLPDRLGPSNVLAPALASAVVGALVVADAWSSTSFLVGGFLAGLGHGYCFPVLSAQVADRVPESLRGSGFAMFTALWELSALAFKPLLGAVAIWTSDSAMFAAMALFATLGLGGWLLLEHSGQRSAQTKRHRRSADGASVR
ncbi:MAG: MFS transporter [Myxococcales bacterium]|nr:MFS transporter [Myxococcales bacterium]